MQLANYDFPLLMVENFILDTELQRIWNEIDTLNLFLKSPEDTGSARDLDNNLKKNNKACWIDEVYGNARNSSFILNLMQNIYSPEFIKQAQELHWFYNYLPDTNMDSTLLSVYEDGDSYKSHADVATITTLIWLWKEPKAFTGGDMIFDKKHNFPIKNNMLVMFPSCIQHEVTEVKMENNPGFGRYVITNFAQLR